MRLWLDVDDLFYFAERSDRPTGIQRLTGEVYNALQAQDPNRVGFVRHSDEACGFSVVNWADVQATYQRLVCGSRLTDTPENSPETPSASPSSLLYRLIASLGFQRPVASDLQGSPTIAKAINLEMVASPGDVLCALGAPWHDPQYENRVARCRATTGALFSLLIHDLIPLLRPEYFELGRAPHFERVIAGILPLTDTILTNSRSTAADVTAWASAKGIRLKKAPYPIPIGTGFARPSGGQLPSGIEAGKYVLFVSTIEARKNHLQAFRIWCRLLRELPRDTVPTLVFAGSWGWMVDDLRKAIEATDHLNGKLQIIISPDDATLAALYRGCKFTLYLSYYEGWGLPVSDSLSFGKLCVASERTSIPEAGGSFSIYVDPDNTSSAYETIHALVTAPETLQRLEAELIANHRPTEWSETAHEIFRLLVSPEATAATAERFR